VLGPKGTQLVDEEGALLAGCPLSRIAAVPLESGASQRPTRGIWHWCWAASSTPGGWWPGEFVNVTNDSANLPVILPGAPVSEYVTIDKAGNLAIADLIKQRLDQSGIPCVLVPSNMAAVAGAGASYAVTVPAERTDEARELIGE
jgi:hypothetical protein